MLAPVRQASLALLIVLLASPSGVQAQGRQADRDTCGRERAAIEDWQLRVRACTAIIDAGGETPATLAAALANRGAAYLKLGDDDRALRDLDRALALDSTVWQAHVNRGSVYGRKGEHHRAIQEFDTALRFDADPKAYFGRGLVYQSLGDNTSALRDVNASISLDATNAGAFVTRGQILRDIGEYDRAQQDFERALAIDRTLWNAWLGQGDIYRLRGEPRVAIDAYTQAARLAPGPSSAVFHGRGLAYLAIGDIPRAIQDLDRALSLRSVSAPLTP
jgi:tetratricopeptide (TPR) repeat protein